MVWRSISKNWFVFEIIRCGGRGNYRNRGTGKRLRELLNYWEKISTAEV